MSRDKELDKPYKLLGDRLRVLREKHSESLSEVSGAVEIEPETLASIEQGATRPSEDILLLLISHFSSRDSEADRLWQLAGYERHDHEDPSISNNDQYSAQPAMMVLPMDARIVYTDTVHVMANNHGVVMNFLQNAGPNGQTIAVARVGMSREHAASVLELLQRTLAQSEPKAISSKNIVPDKKTSKKAEA
jgi:DNA-binding XRE family transcriptional regulator